MARRRDDRRPWIDRGSAGRIGLALGLDQRVDGHDAFRGDDDRVEIDRADLRASAERSSQLHQRGVDARQGAILGSLSTHEGAMPAGDPR